MNQIALGSEGFKIEDILQIADGAKVSLSEDEVFRKKLTASRDFLDHKLDQGDRVYGVTTGFGDSCTVNIEKDLLKQLPIHITRYHSCGMGDIFNKKETRAIQAVRLASLGKGFSAVSIELLDSITRQINADIQPRIPKEGSVGASGDLTPLAYMASTLIGEGKCFHQGELHETKELYEKLDLPRYELKPKEGLALMNGTAVMTALACLAYERAERLADFSCKITAMNLMAMRGNAFHFDEDLFVAKPHPGQMLAAKNIRDELQNYDCGQKDKRLQDRYSLRCAPHVIGVLYDMLPSFRSMIEVELNSANDNPLVIADKEKILHGGNFYGGHVAFVMDSMKNLVANIADLLDRQLALLVDPKFNDSLPANLSGSEGRNKVLNHGFKAVQISVSAWTAEALKLTMPASVFSRSTECHNQDKVSMGTIAARDCIRVLELSEQVLAANALASVQALDLRHKAGQLNPEHCSDLIKNLMTEIRSFSDFLEEDRGLEEDMRTFLAKLDQGVFRV